MRLLWILPDGLPRRSEIQHHLMHLIRDLPDGLPQRGEIQRHLMHLLWVDGGDGRRDGRDVLWRSLRNGCRSWPFRYGQSVFNY
jgi:hypothetical protein